MYYVHSQFHKLYLVLNPIGKIINQIDVGIHANTLFNLSDEECELIRKINANKEQYYDKNVIKKNRKKREIIKYRNDANGNAARKLHEHLLKEIYKIYYSDLHSFAYQKGKTISDCANKHIGGKGFIKYDIHKFFNSISYKLLRKCFITQLNIDRRCADIVDEILNTCFYENELPLGLVLSPMLSDMYMKEFDGIISCELEKQGLVYTRYADDILISKNDIIDIVEKEKIQKLIDGQISKLNLSLNEEKQQYINFDEKHSFVKYIGISIVRGELQNYLSVGKSYINEIAKSYLNYCDKVEEYNNYNGMVNYDKKRKMELERDIHFERLIIIGKIGFLKQIEGNKGYKRLLCRLSKYKKKIILDDIFS